MLLYLNEALDLKHYDFLYTLCVPCVVNITKKIANVDNNINYKENQ